MRSIILSFMLLSSSLYSCDKFMSLKKAAVILESTVRRLNEPVIKCKILPRTIAQSALSVYRDEYSDACEACQRWADGINHGYIMILTQYVNKKEKE